MLHNQKGQKFLSIFFYYHELAKLIRFFLIPNILCLLFATNDLFVVQKQTLQIVAWKLYEQRQRY